MNSFINASPSASKRGRCGSILVLLGLLNLILALPLQAAKPTAPVAPSNVAAAAASSSQINLSWRDNSANESGFIVQRALSSSGPWGQIATAGANVTSYANSGLSAGATYYYRVCAYNSRGASPYSSVASASTSQSLDTTAPSVPVGLTATAASSSQINLSWSAATDTGGSGLAGYKVYRNGVQIGTTATPSYSSTGLAAGTSYCYTVGAYDNGGNNSAQSAQVCRTTPTAADTAAPSVPAGLTVTAASSSQINLSWSAATDSGGSGLAGYRVYRNGVQIDTTSTPSYSSMGLAAGTSYCYTVGAYDNAGNSSAQTPQVCRTTPTAADTTAPSVPSGLTATAASSSQINLSWGAATDTGGSGLAGYRVYRNGVQIDTTSTPSYSSMGLAAGASYCYTVGAYDNAGNSSAQTPQVCRTTPTAADTTAPSVPSGLTATAASASQINLSWGAATDTGGSGLAGYRVYRNGVQIGTTATPSYSSTGLAAGTSYCYTVGAYDNAGNNSAQTPQVCRTTPTAADTTAPSVPSGLTATAASASQINLSWSAATDNTGGSGLSGYKIYRSGVQIGTTTTPSYANTGLAANTTYSYTVAAYDVTGNTSGQSAQASATTVTTLGTTDPWVRQLGGNGTDGAAVMAVDTGGNYVVAGTFSSTASFGTQVLTSAGGRDIFIAKLGSDGTVQWARAFGGAGQEYVNAIVLDGNNNIFLGGYFEGSANFGAGARLSAGKADGWLAKYLPDGSFDAARGSWLKTFGGTNDDTVSGMDLDLAQQNIVVTGTFGSVADFGGTPLIALMSTDDAFLAKFSTSNGAHVFSKSFNNAGMESGKKVFVDKSSNDIVLVGNFDYMIDLGGGMLFTGGGGKDIFMGRFTASGSHLWSKRYGGTNPDLLFSAALDSHGGLVLAGTFKYGTDLGGGPIGGTGATDMFLAKYSAVDGSFAWARLLRCSSFGNPNAVTVDAQDNPVITAGYNGTCNIGAQSFTSAGTLFDTDLLVVKYSGAGAILWAESLGGVASVSSAYAAIDRANCSMIVGTFVGTADFGGESLTAAGGSADAFVLKLEP